MQLFWHSKELVSELYDNKTLSQLEIHTGFGISGYDLVRGAYGYGGNISPFCANGALYTSPCGQ
jgi:hypothetical protein